jgi:diketogulonate reductase-like aldo/keto reductase
VVLAALRGLGVVGGFVAGWGGCAPRGGTGGVRAATGTIGARRVPLIGMGTYTLGDDPARRRQEIAALRVGLELGLRHIDTAEMYGDGRAESLIGEALAGGRRGQAFLCTKVRPDRASAAGTIASLDESLARLRTDHVDLFLLHNLPTRYPLEETMHALRTALRAGKARAIGVSNFETLPELDRAAAPLDGVALSCDQVKYGLRTRRAERALSAGCRARGIALVGYQPFDGLPAEGTERARLDALAATRGVTVHQLVLAYLCRDGVFQIPRAARVEHVRDNAAALRLRLAASEVAEIDALFPLV